MRFITRVQPFAVAVNAAIKLAKEDAGLKVLGCVLVETQDDAVEITATDGETTVTYRLPAAVTAPGNICIPGSTLASYLSNLPDGEVALESDNFALATLRHGTSKVDIFSLPSDSYPRIPLGKTRQIRDIQGSRLATAIGTTTFAAGKSNTEPAVLQNVMVGFGRTGLCLTATDGYRLARYEHGTQDSTTKAFVVPLRGLQAIARAFENSPAIDISTKSIKDSENHLVVTDGMSTVISRLVNSEYPSVENIINVVPSLKISVDHEPFYGALRRAELMTDHRTRSLHLLIKQNRCEITVESATHGKGQEVIGISQDGSSLDIDINAHYLVEILKHLDAPRVTLGFAGPYAPISIRAQANAGAEEHGPQYLLMPLKTTAKAA